MASKNLGLPTGSNKVIEASRWTFDNTGLSRLTQTWVVNTSAMPGVVPRWGDPHPTYPNLYVSQPIDAVDEPDGSTTRMTIIWEGFQPTGSTSDISTLAPVYEWSGSIEQAPIETNPQYLAAVELNRAAGKDPCDEFGRFIDFPEGAELDGRSIAGVRSYPVSAGTWTKRWIQSSRPTDVSGVGYIDTPDGTPPNFGGDRQWIKGPLAYREAGGVFDCSQSWFLSGQGGASAFVQTEL